LADDHPILYTPLDDKPKRSGDPLALARVRDIAADPRVTVLIDRWDEDWTRLAWLRAEATADLMMPGTDGPDTRERATAIAALRDRYRQYERHHLEERPLIRITIERVAVWGPLR
jgi:PPOX class probable F420-dependent enzyme